MLYTTPHILRCRYPGLMRLRIRTIHRVDHHGHSPRQMPHDMAMEQPHPRIVRPEAKDGVSAPRDLHGIAQDGPAEVIRARVVGRNVVIQARRRARCVPGVVGSPSIDGAVCRQDVEIMAMLFPYKSAIHI